MKLVQVYEHKKIKVKDELKDILKLSYVTYADIKEGFAIIKELQDKKVKKISNSMSEILNEDFIYDEVNVPLISFGDDSLSEEEILEKAKSFLLNQYYEVYEEKGILLSLKEIFDDGIKEEYNRYVVPSLGNEIELLIENMGESGTLILGEDIKNQLIRKTDYSESQNSNDNKSIINYDIKEIYNKLKEIIYGQDEQLKIFLANIIKNMSLSHSNLDVEIIKRLKSNVLLIGPTGTGKTLMIESLANVLDVPYIICDAKRYTSNGYVGEDIESILVDLYHSCHEDMEKFKHGIIFIDEFDKLCEVKDEKSHVNTTDVQESILKLLDGTIVNKTIRKGFVEEHLSFDTSKITFVLSGAFTKMFETETIIDENTLKNTGMISELAGRIGSVIVLNKPNKEDLKNSLNGKYSYLKLFNTYLEMLNVNYELNNEFIDWIVDSAFEMDLGYRGLEKAISANVDEQLYDLISGDTKKFVYQKKIGKMKASDNN